MIGAAKRYSELLVDLAFKRRLAGGALAPEEESPIVGALDRCWRQMSDQEQDEAELRYSGVGRVVAPEHLTIEDLSVAIGDHTAPRRAA